MNKLDEKNNKPESTASIFNLSEDEKIDLIEKANRNDSQASFRLYKYYFFSNDSRSDAIQWLKKSAQDGNQQAQHILGIFYLEFLTPKNIEEGKYWLRKSAANGYLPAKEDLEKIEKKADHGK